MRAFAARALILKRVLFSPPPKKKFCVLKGHQLLQKSRIFPPAFSQRNVTAGDDGAGIRGRLAGGCRWAHPSHSRAPRQGIHPQESQGKAGLVVTHGSATRDAAWEKLLGVPTGAGCGGRKGTTPLLRPQPSSAPRQPAHLRAVYLAWDLAFFTEKIPRHPHRKRMCHSELFLV